MNTTYIKKPDILKWYIYKILLIMRLTTVILMISMLQVSASTVAQEFNYVKKGVSLIQIFKEIKKQTGYKIIWNEKKIDVTTTVDANFKKATIHNVLNKCLRNFPLSYTINDKMVVIKEEKPSFRKKLADFFKYIDVRGRVVDENNRPLVGATVKVKNSTRSTLTDEKGSFILNNIEEESVLVISYLGYDTKEIKAAEDLKSISLILSTGRLQEVEVNAGYYKVKDRERTGSISRVTSKDIEKQPITNVLQAMKANIPGVQVTQTTGVPGGGFTVQIRGRNSISQGNQPFYVIDGVPFTATGIAGSKARDITENANPLASINPFDIESVEVLKDADATAIYGSRGANGVILITTKKGKSGKSRASATISEGFSRVGRKLDLMDTEQYLTMRREGLSNDKLPISATDYDLNGKWDNTRNVDWQKELIGDVAPITNILTSLSGGSSNTAYLVGGSYYREETVFPGDHSYARSSGNFSLQYLSDNQKLHAAVQANYSQINSNLFITDLTQFIALAPNYPSLLDDNGLLNWGDNTMYLNPIAETQKPYNAKTSNLVSNAQISYEFIPDLKLKASLGYTVMDRKELSMIPLNTYSPVLNYGTDRRESNFTNNSTNTWIIEAQADWNKQFGFGKLNVILGTTFQQDLNDGQEVKGTGYASDALMANIAAASVFTIPNRYYSQYRYMALFSRLNYAINDKYFINITGRRDGSSRFGTDNRFANFGAIGAAWLISEEGFITRNLPFVSFAKLRGSYGVTGNDQIKDYGYLELWRSLNTYQNISTMSPLSISNPNYAWEVNKKVELAIELGFFKDRLSLSTGYFSNRSSSQLVQRALTPSTGFASIQDNLPAKVSNTGWEFEFSTRNISKNDFKWSTSVNLTVPRNKLIAYPDLDKSSFSNTYKINYPLSISNLYSISIDPNSGLYLREDYDGNGILNINDQFITSYRGPKFYGGIQNTFQYKALELNFMFQFIKQTGTSYLTSFNLPGGFSTQTPTYNQPTELLNRWQNNGEVSKYQKYSTLSTANTSFNNARIRGTLAIDDTSFIRLNNVSLYYSLPRQLLDRVKFKSAKFFLLGQNLFTITPYKGLDPETQNSSRLPMLQVITAGIQLTL